MTRRQHFARSALGLRQFFAALEERLPTTESRAFLQPEASRLKQLLEAFVGHWDAIENGTHHVRDVTFGEDACRIAKPTAARNMVTLRNLVIGLFELHQHNKGGDAAPSLSSWRRRMSVSKALALITTQPALHKSHSHRPCSTQGA